jgi:SHS2 domain-containing protein
MPYRWLEHTADIRLRVTGATRKRLFRDALRGLAAAMRPRAAGAPVERRLTLEAGDATALLVDFLGEALALMQARRESYRHARFARLSEHRLEATLRGATVEGVDEDVKAVTYHEAAVAAGAGGGWQTNLVLDV